jgi:SAM-dependent methyltransferase
MFSRLYGESAFIEMQICRECSFVQAKHPYSEESIARLYLDYRKDSYNNERIQYEPGYRDIAARVGTDLTEVDSRVAAATDWLADKIEMSPDFTMLDYGGADGRFLPKLAAKKFVYELSDTEPIPGITRIRREADLTSYSYIHLAHVLEHVVDPLKLVQHVAGYLEPGGYFYIEVPQELSDQDLQSLQAGTYRSNVGVHEHINIYSSTALSQLMKKANLELLAFKADKVDLGWAQGVHLRALGRKVSS